MEFAVAAAERWDHGLPVDQLLGIFFDLVADEGGDFAQVEVRQQDAHDNLSGAESSDTASAGGFGVFGAVALDLVVQRLDGVAGVGVEFIPLLRSVFEGLGVASVVRGVEGCGVLAADLVGKVGQVFSVDSGANLVCHGLEELPQGTGHVGLGPRACGRAIGAAFNVEGTVVTALVPEAVDADVGQAHG